MGTLAVVGEGEVDLAKDVVSVKWLRIAKRTEMGRMCMGRPCVLAGFAKRHRQTT